MPWLSGNCPNCGGKLQFNTSNNTAICEHCGTPFMAEKTDDSHGKQKPDYKIVGGRLVKYRGASNVIHIPDGVVSIEKECFYDMSDLEVFIPTTLTQEGGFSGLDSLHKVILAEGYERIPDRMFLLSFNLEEVIIPDSIKTIGEWAFMDSGIEVIRIPRNCTIKLSAFSGSHLERIDITFPIKMEISVGIGRPNIFTGEYKKREIIIVEVSDNEHLTRMITKEYSDQHKYFIPFNHTPFENKIIKDMGQ